MKREWEDPLNLENSECKRPDAQRQLSDQKESSDVRRQDVCKEEPRASELQVKR